MIDSLYVVAFVPARGGSKSVPYKNLFPLGGRPLLAWPIETALATPEIDRVFVSTEDARIAAVARQLGGEIHDRPPALATDSAPVIDAIRHFHRSLTTLGQRPDIIVLLEPTSPFRTPELVSRCLQRLVEEDLDSIATFSDATINPERCWRMEAGRMQPFMHGAIPWKPRQQLTPAYQLNGAVYAFRSDRLPADGLTLLFGRSGAEVVSSNEVIDIDDARDFAVANAILESRNRTNAS